MCVGCNGRHIDSGALVVPGIEDVVVAIVSSDSGPPAIPPRSANFPSRMAASSLCNSLPVSVFSLERDRVSSCYSGACRGERGILVFIPRVAGHMAQGDMLFDL